MKSLFFLAFAAFLYDKLSCHTSFNNRPIIGIMTEEFSENSIPVERSFIMAFYVKFLEASGARAVPIFIYKSEEYYKDILKKINGVLLPGGGDLLNSIGYGRTAKLIFDIAVEMNEKGDYFPVWGTCLGFEFLNFAVANKTWMKACNAEDWVTNIDLVNGYSDSKMFSKLPKDMKKKIQSENVTLHLHHWCITPENYSVSGLDKYFKVLALSRDSRNETFVSIIEAYKYPFYGVAFHPERVLFDWTQRNVPTPHSLDAIKISQFFGNFFINEARKNFHRFPSEEEETSALIYNYNPLITEPEPSAQLYAFQ